MKASTIQRLDTLFSRTPALVAGPTSAVDIDLAEKQLGRQLAPEYREFVARYGGAIVGSLPLLGLRQAEVMGDDLYSVVDVTQRFQNTGWSPTEEWVVVSVDLAGNPIGIDDNGEVWTVDHDVAVVFRVASCFEEFIVQLLDR